MENKYYTPAIEDLHVGYEYEYRVGKNYAWNTAKILDLYTDRDGCGTYEVEQYLGEGNIRTPYLTKEQIESEGWEIKTYDIHKAFDFAFKKENYFGVRLKTGKLDIHMADVIKDKYLENTSHGRLYYGECKSINEFRTICKLLNIN